MSKLATKSDLQEMYSRILPYLGGQADAGFTPVGTVISVMGTTAPENYLACNGQVVNIADYPELADYFYVQFGSKSKFGGNGTTTFGIPDLRGQFLRGTGTNSDTTQGSGSSVGTRQKATEMPVYLTNNAETALIFPVHATGSDATKPKVVNQDTTSVTGDNFGNLAITSKSSGTASTRVTTRPTNTSILFCIATKNIYLNPENDYSTSEKVVGHWIDGKTLYQRTFALTIPTYTEGTSDPRGERLTFETDISRLTIDKFFVVRCDYTYMMNNEFNLGYGGTIDVVVDEQGQFNTYCRTWSGISGNERITISIRNKTTILNGANAYVTVQYTKQ